VTAATAWAPTPAAPPRRAERSAHELLALGPLEELEEKAREARFGAALCGLTILRYLSDCAPRLPLALLGRLVGSNDTVMALAPLLDSPPWQRTRNGKVGRALGA
jgi:hypothetical protein